MKLRSLGLLGRGPDDPTSNRGQPDRDRRTWFRLLFESQLAAYEPNAQGQASQGWYYWTCKSGRVNRGSCVQLGVGKLMMIAGLFVHQGKRNGRSIRGLTAVEWKMVTSPRTSVIFPPGHSRSSPTDVWIRALITRHRNRREEGDLGMPGRGWLRMGGLWRSS